MRLYRFESDKYYDAWNKPVEVHRLVEYIDVEITGKREYNNGYEKVMIDVASDGKRTFSRPIEVDYFGGGVWYEDGVIGKSWRTSKKLPDERFVDAVGKPFTKQQLIDDEFGGLK